MRRGIGRIATQRGQSMTEFLIAASTVLVPLFIAVPMLTKYVDIRHATIQAARYEAWEYTAWYNGTDDNDILDNFSAVSVPVKSPAQTQAEARRRFFSDISEQGTLPVRGGDRDTDWQASERNAFWTDNIHGTPLYTSGDYDDSAALVSSTDTPTLPILGDVLNTLIDIVDFAFSALGSVLGFLGSSAAFTAINTEAYSTSTVAIPVRKLDFFGDRDIRIGDDISQTSELVFSASASVLGDGWNAGGKEHASNQVQGTIPTILFKSLTDTSTAPGQVLGPVWDVVSILAPELARCFDEDNRPTNPILDAMLNAMDRPNGSLWWGHVEFDAVHPDRLASGGGHECDEAGVCQFDEDNRAAVEDLVCVY